MKTNIRKRIVFYNGYERMAFIAMELLTGNRTQEQLAGLLGMSPQRVSQLYIAALARVGETHTQDAQALAAKYRRLVYRRELPYDDSIDGVHRARAVVPRPGSCTDRLGQRVTHLGFLPSLLQNQRKRACSRPFLLHVHPTLRAWSLRGRLRTASRRRAGIQAGSQGGDEVEFVVGVLCQLPVILHQHLIPRTG